MNMEELGLLGLTDVRKLCDKEIITVTPESLEEHFKSPEFALAKKWAQTNGFTGKKGQVLIVPNARGQISKVFAGVSNPDDMYEYAAIRSKLPQGTYRFNKDMTPEQMTIAALGWALDAYDYKRLAEISGDEDYNGAVLSVDASADAQAIERDVVATCFVRSLVNMPANQLTTDELAKIASNLLNKTAANSAFNASAKITKGDDLLSQDYPLIHTVGRASDHKPQLVDFVWGDERHPKLTLVGKGIVFDTGGLGIKPGNSMRDMKKDMGGAAHVLALAKMIMDANLPVRLRVMVPIAENSINGNAYRPGDVMQSRVSKTSGKSVAIENEHTDAEGRLVMADCLIDAADEKPDMLIDFATLTGAQRVAHGLEIGGIMGTDKQMLRDLEDMGEENGDWLASLPLHERYRPALSSPFADCKSGGGQAGTITAALFLKQFTKSAKDWLHFDISAWNPASKPGRPYGGEALGLRTMYQYLEKKYRP
ncbi:MAG: leucyl aminopeptidase family protein [Pseudomonadota bacterium]|nr:leucyl aminopeptidase family protein [Pseudomonadota bacterium]